MSICKQGQIMANWSNTQAYHMSWYKLQQQSLILQASGACTIKHFESANKFLQILGKSILQSVASTLV
jgi:hypothetical protein